ncbi:fumarylacetoacetate hydrolase family protein [Vibrio sp. SCSIO 43136]|uniref:fumarylacetoacetate hydrolase family protein n=1 Tax=Vibrio sp. SCSIO 43136 TaxID=2819101 RepID=UPI00207592A4|nr:fumarylacetoacetate hydrolase family protein [Vibrio sp. SCSIO 43136]USD67126.1 fumarylacetoacetate hydrolase family protein [Vibrio sp. SCSIO 43136]
MQTVSVEGHEYTPSKIVCVGRNYVEHIQELGNAMPDSMVLFHKPNSAITSELFAYHQQEQLHYEAELCFAIKDSQLSAVAIGLDLTKRALQSQLKQKQLPWERAKAFDGSAIFSRFISLEGLDIASLEIELYINCVRVQKGDTSQMLYPPCAILQEVCSYTSLQDGDILMTGTPKGVGTVERDDLFLARIRHAGEILLEVEWVAK